MATRRKPRKARPFTHRTRMSKSARVWTREEIAFLRKYYRNHETTWCARQLGRTVYSVRYKASDLSIRKANPSNWKPMPKNKVSFPKPTTNRVTRTTRRNIRWAKTRRNNRRTRW